MSHRSCTKYMLWSTLKTQIVVRCGLLMTKKAPAETSAFLNIYIEIALFDHIKTAVDEIGQVFAF